MDNTEEGVGAAGMVAGPKLRSGCWRGVGVGAAVVVVVAGVFLGRPLVWRFISAGKRGGVRSAMVRLAEVEIGAEAGGGGTWFLILLLLLKASS
jgi:hypothetical protein